MQARKKAMWARRLVRSARRLVRSAHRLAMWARKLVTWARRLAMWARKLAMLQCKQEMWGWRGLRSHVRVHSMESGGSERTQCNQNQLPRRLLDENPWLPTATVRATLSLSLSIQEQEQEQEQRQGVLPTAEVEAQARSAL